MPNELQKLTVVNTVAWRAWLAGEGTSSPGVWLTIAKKPTSTLTTLTYPQALDEALCQGWIDSTGYKIDETTHVVRFTPRKPKSIWSKRNVGYIERLEREGRMQPAGRAVVEAAKRDGRWDAAYSGSGTAEPPEEFMVALRANPAALATWDGLNKGNRWTIYFTLLNLRTPAGREKRIKGFVEMLARGEGPKPQKRKRKPDATTQAEMSVPPEEAENSNCTSQEAIPSASRVTRSGRPAPSYRA